MSEWLDLELSHHLAPVTAPDALWDRVISAAPVSQQSGDCAGLAACGAAWQAARRLPTAANGRLSIGRRLDNLPHAAWPIAAILTLAAAAGALWLVAKGAEPALDLHQL